MKVYSSKTAWKLHLSTINCIKYPETSVNSLLSVHILFPSWWPAAVKLNLSLPWRLKWSDALFGKAMHWYLPTPARLCVRTFKRQSIKVEKKWQRLIKLQKGTISPCLGEKICFEWISKGAYQSVFFIKFNLCTIQAFIAHKCTDNIVKKKRFWQKTLIVM